MVKKMRKWVQYIQRYSTKYAEPREHAMQFPSVSLFSSETTGLMFTKIFTLYRGISGAIIFCKYKVLSRSVSEWHSDKVDWLDWSGKNADFSTLIGCHGNVP